jgi:superfamily II DNA or RNA helicase
MNNFPFDKVIRVEGMALVHTPAPDALKKALTLQNTQKSLILPVYKTTDDPSLLWIPRAIAQQPVDTIEWKRFHFKHNIKLRPLQQTLLNAFLQRMDVCGGILSAGTGVGKTVMGLWLTALYGLKTLIIVPTDMIFKQWIDRIQTFLDVPNIGIIRGAVCKTDAPITVAMLHTIVKPKFKHLHKEFGLVIYDEVHTVATQLFHNACGKFHSKFNIGLSASPYRKDGMANVFLWHIGPIYASMKKVDSVPRVNAVFLKNDVTTYTCRRWDGKLNLGKFYNQLVNVPSRNQMIMKYAIKAYQNDYKTLILTERLEHIDILKQLLISKIPADHIGILTANIKELDKPIIIGTYGSAGMGLDIPSLSCLILATPRTDVLQPVGRVTRAKDIQPVIIDLIDVNDKMMVAWWQKRKKVYASLGCNLRELVFWK